jgi:hypothetical protein
VRTDFPPILTALEVRTDFPPALTALDGEDRHSAGPHRLGHALRRHFVPRLTDQICIAVAPPLVVLLTLGNVIDCTVLFGSTGTVVA